MNLSRNFGEEMLSRVRQQNFPSLCLKENGLLRSQLFVLPLENVAIYLGFSDKLFL